VQMHVHFLIEVRRPTPGRNTMAGWDERIAQLEAEFPGWHIWRSSAGRWWATRTGTVPRREDLGTGRVMTADADDESALRDQLAVQMSLDRDIAD
jgi:hypothetical protein